MTDEEIAHAVLKEMFPRGTVTAGARTIEVGAKTFGRWCKGGAIKSVDMPKLHGLDGYSEAFSALKQDVQPRIDPKAREALARLTAALGTSLLRALTYEIENLVQMLGPEKSVLAIERLVLITRDAAESALELIDRQKVS